LVAVLLIKKILQENGSQNKFDSLDKRFH